MKNIADICRQFGVRLDHGRICTPGMFEGERIYVPYYWDAYLNGCADSDDGRIVSFDITDEDRAIFGELLKDKRAVLLYQREDGFVCEV